MQSTQVSYNWLVAWALCVSPRNCSTLTGFFCSVCSSVTFLLGIFWLFKFERLINGLQPMLRLRLHNEYGTTHEFTDLWDRMQSDNRCCGIAGPQDYIMFNRSFPMSCCAAIDLSDVAAISRRPLASAVYLRPNEDDVLMMMGGSNSGAGGGTRSASEALLSLSTGNVGAGVMGAASAASAAHGAGHQGQHHIQNLSDFVDGRTAAVTICPGLFPQVCIAA